MALVQLEGVTYTYPLEKEPALKALDLQIEAGEFVAVVGPNLSGKSTLCYTLAGFVPHFFKGQLQGRVQVAGRSLAETSLSEWVQQVGLVFQNPFTQMSGAKFNVYEELAFGLENLGVPRPEMRRRLEWGMELTDIAHLSDRSPYELSGGQQQRVALASILVMQPQLLVLDEPTSQLDPISTREMFAAVDRLTDTEGTTVVLASHKLEWIARFADRVLLLVDGAIRLQGRPQEVLTSPLLAEAGVAPASYTQAARAAQQAGLWPAGRPLPVTLDEAVEGFEEFLGG